MKASTHTTNAGPSPVLVAIWRRRLAESAQLPTTSARNKNKNSELRGFERKSAS